MTTSGGLDPGAWIGRLLVYCLAAGPDQVGQGGAVDRRLALAGCRTHLGWRPPLHGYPTEATVRLPGAPRLRGPAALASEREDLLKRLQMQLQALTRPELAIAAAWASVWHPAVLVPHLVGLANGLACYKARGATALELFRVA